MKTYAGIYKMKQQITDFEAPTQEELSKSFNEQLAKARHEAEQCQATVIDVQGLRNDVNAMREAYQSAGGGIQLLNHLAPFFSIAFLTQEGITDVAKLDIPYMTTLGQQVIQDSRGLVAEHREMSAKFNGLIANAESILNTQGKIDDQAIVHVSTDIVFFTENIKEWALRFNTICLAAINDIVTHLNTARPADRQITL